jgi:hypothetical protein
MLAAFGSQILSKHLTPTRFVNAALTLFATGIPTVTLRAIFPA